MTAINKNLNAIYLLIQDSSGSTGTDDLRHNTRGSPHNGNYLRQKRPQCEDSFYVHEPV